MGFPLKNLEFPERGPKCFLLTFMSHQAKILVPKPDTVPSGIGVPGLERVRPPGV